MSCALCQNVCVGGAGVCISVVEGDQVVLLPHSSVVVALPISESALSVNEIPLESALNHFSVRQDQPACALLAVLPELSLVPHPVVLHLVEICTVEGTVEGQGVFVVENALPVEFALCPHAVVGRPALTVVEDAPSADFPLLELTLVVGAVGEEQLAPPVLLACQQLALVGASLLVLSFVELYLLQTVAHPACLHLALPLQEALLARLEVLQLVPEGELRDGEGACGGGEDVCAGGSEFEVPNGVEDGLGLRIEEGVFDGFLEGALLQLADVLQVLPDHLQQPRVGVQVLLVLLGLFGEGVFGVRLVIGEYGLAYLGLFCLELWFATDAFLQLAVDGGQIAEHSSILLGGEDDFLLSGDDVEGLAAHRTAPFLGRSLLLLLALLCLLSPVIIEGLLYLVVGGSLCWVYGEQGIEHFHQLGRVVFCHCFQQTGQIGLEEESLVEVVAIH